MTKRQFYFLTTACALMATASNAQTERADFYQDSGADWAIGGTGENLEIIEPESGNKVWARFNDDRSFELLGTPDLVTKGDVRAGNISAADNKRIVAGELSGSSPTGVSLVAAERYSSAYVEYVGGPLIFQRYTSKYRSPLTLQPNGTVVVNALSSYDGRTLDTRGHELSVVGGILCEEIEVIADVPESDYVFEDDYDLPTLDSVAAFIEKNNHLPGVPSAEEFKGGYKVGEMDDLLLRKVEELTLYVLQLKHELYELKNPNSPE